MRRIKVYGIVQSVGFRPFVSRLAKMCGIKGTVANKGAYVEILAQGENLPAFVQRIRRDAPSRAVIDKITVEQINDECEFDGFSIAASFRGNEESAVLVPPDIAVCDKCRRELFDPHDRRYLHPFINCTECGPRLTIMEGVPYDRPVTSMKNFPLCEECRREYENPDSRRYDAQPVCCPQCGPAVYILGTDKKNGDAISAARKIIAEGGIVAVKGIGGFHLATDATNEEAVSRLRRLKHRPGKPLAVMMKNIATVRGECMTDEAQEKLLDGWQKPIVLLKRKSSSRLAPSISPNNPNIGVILPYTPLHLLLFDYPDGVNMPDMLVMTSGNASGAPICRTEDDAAKTLTAFADAILSHNRPIRLRADDSVTDWLFGKAYMIRRSRGYAPLPVKLSGEWRGEVLAMGGDLKNCFCLAKNNFFYCSPYIGDMADLRASAAQEDSIALMEELLAIRPAVVACDPHPLYQTRRAAEKLPLPVVFVQHHWAHILSVMAENNVAAPVIGIAFDGTGYGTDKTIWGGEVLLSDYGGFRRLGSIESFALAGGDKAAKDGWRSALSLIKAVVGNSREERNIANALNLASNIEQNAQQFLLESNFVNTTSVGRLFDAVSALLGFCRSSTFEGEAAMRLMFAAEEYGESLPQNFDGTQEFCFAAADLLRSTDGTERFILPTNKLFDGILRRRLAGENVAELAYVFHAELAALVLLAAEQARKTSGVATVALAGGVFQNTLLVKLCHRLLVQSGFLVLTAHEIPANDGGISLGQAAAAMYRLTKWKERKATKQSE